MEESAKQAGLRASTSTITPKSSHNWSAFLKREKGREGWETVMTIILKVKFSQLGFVHAKACSI